MKSFLTDNDRVLLNAYLKDLKECLLEAPIDFEGTRSDDGAEKEEAEWKLKWMNAFFQADDLINKRIK